MSNLSEKAVKLYNQGYSCSQALVKSAYDSKLISHNMDVDLLCNIALPFSAGMGSGCLCGAVAGAQMVLGIVADENPSSKNAKVLAKEYIDQFKVKRKVTCCKALTAKYEFGSPERRENCMSIVQDAAEILSEVLKSV